ncbi:RHS repeat-associated core domain-containing protein [Vibrio lentus]
MVSANLSRIPKLNSYLVDGTVYHVHNDHLGTPQALTDETGATVWKASYSPFGKATVTTEQIKFNLRFPGQYYDAETGLHYNWHRYYDPNTGMYITSDPIGLAGGINTYAYALNNPAIYTDPTGLWVPQIIGAMVNIGFEGYRQYQTGSFDAGRLLVAGATGALGGFGSTLRRAVFFGASSGAIGNMYIQLTEKSSGCDQRYQKSLDLYQVGRSAILGSFGGAVGFGGGILGKNILRPRDIIGVDLKKRVSFNYESYGSAIGSAGGTTIGNQ